VEELLADPDTDGVLICSSPAEHYEHILMAINARKAVFAEKPLVTRLDHFTEISRMMEKRPILLSVGLNRRYSPLVDRLRSLLTGPIDCVDYLVTQPYTPPEHWSLDEIDGGGRLITEGEHFIDLCNLLIDRDPISLYARALGRMPDDIRTLCNWGLTLHYEGAVANVIFNESGAAKYPRERVTVLARGQVAVLDDFATLTYHGKRRKSYGNGVRRFMGHKQALKEFVAALRGEPNRLLTWEEASTATRCMFAAQESISSGEVVDLRAFIQESENT
jgi:predicted dehydrogenase